MILKYNVLERSFKLKKKQLVIAIDPGFDACKIIINKEDYTIPFVAQDITDILDSYDLRRKDENFIKCEFEGKTYIVGEVARTYLLTNERRSDIKAEMEEFYTLARFKNKSYEVCINAFIAYALCQYEKSSIKSGKDIFRVSELEQWEMIVGVALPHQYMDDLIPLMESYLIKNRTNFKLTIGDASAVEFTFNINECIFNSQTICALLNEVTDENGNDIEGLSVFDTLPALILDGGYKTFGMFLFERDQSITGAESNQDYAMKNINEAVAEQIRKHKPDVYDYMIEELCKKKEILRYLDDDDKIVEIDVQKIKDEIMDLKIADLVKYLLKKYDNLLEVKTVLISGGTGQIYFPKIKKYFSENREYLVDKTTLPTGMFNGKPIAPVNAIVIGLFKDMCGQLSEE